MSAVVAGLLALGVFAALLGSVACWRMPPLGRVHAVAFVNLVSGGAVTLAACLQDGLSSRTGKVLAIWLLTMLIGALSAHVTGRAILLRGGGGR